MSVPPMIPGQFEVAFYPATGDSKDLGLCNGAFSEVSGLEATMEPRAIREGGMYRGEYQRAGQVTYATVILKRGMTPAHHLWTWFDLVGGQNTGLRLRAELTHFQSYRKEGGQIEKVARYRWVMSNALPVKFKAATYSGAAADVGIEELHFVHEGMTLVPGANA